MNWRKRNGWLVLGVIVGAAMLADLARTLREHRSLESHWASVRGHRLHWRQANRATTEGRPPVVLVHGYGISSSYMIPLAAGLAATYPVYAPDLPGHGWSEKPPEVLDVTELADSLVAWMDVVGLERAILIGNSMGCQIATHVATRYASRVSRLVLIGPTADRNARSLPRQLWRFLLGGAFERPSLVLLLAWDYARAGVRRIYVEARHMLADEIEQRLGEIPAPVLVVRGRFDTIVPMRWAEEVARLAHAEQVVVISGTGHAVNYSAPERLLGEITPFLQERDPVGFRGT